MDYARRFTPEGGIALIYKTLDARAWRFWLRVLLWILAMAATAWFILRALPSTEPPFSGAT